MHPNFALIMLCAAGVLILAILAKKKKSNY